MACSDGTPAKNYIYGTSNPESVEGFAVTNGIGWLVEAYAGSNATDEAFDYKKVGRIALAAEATSDSGGWYQVYANYFFNGTPDALLLENGAGADLLPGETFYAANGGAGWRGRPTAARRRWRRGERPSGGRKQRVWRRRAADDVHEHGGDLRRIGASGRCAPASLRPVWPAMRADPVTVLRME